MLIDIQDFLDHAQINHPLYPGKRVVKPCTQIGEYKNHCVIIDWRNPDEITIEVKPGLTGKQLAPEAIRKYPVCFQMPTSIKIDVMQKIGRAEKTDTRAEEEEEEEGKTSGGTSGKGGSGGKKPRQKKDTKKVMSLEDILKINARFDDSAQGSIPNLGEIREMMIMGIQIAKEGFANAFTELTKQIAHAKMTMTEVLEKAADIVTKVEPPSFIKPRGNETTAYIYDRHKNANIGFKNRFG